MTPENEIEMSDDTNRIPTNLRMLLIFEALATSGRAMTPSELGEEIDLPKPTLHRLCTTLETEGFLIRDHHSGATASGAARACHGDWIVDRISSSHRTADGIENSGF